MTKLKLQPSKIDELMTALSICRTYWGSHGCDKPQGHVENGDPVHQCGTDNDPCSQATLNEGDFMSEWVEEPNGQVRYRTFNIIENDDGSADGIEEVGWSEWHPTRLYGEGFRIIRIKKEGEVMASTSFYCEPKWHEGEGWEENRNRGLPSTLDADFKVYVGSGRTVRFACCERHLGNAIMELKRNGRGREPLNFRIIRIKKGGE